MSNRLELAAELKRQLQPMLTRMRREQWLVSLAGSLRLAILIAALLTALRAALGEPSPPVITILSILPVLWRALSRQKGLDLSDAAVAVDHHAGLKDRVTTAVANCRREEWPPLVERQVEDAVARLAKASPPFDRRALPSLASRGLLLAALLAVAWLWPFPGIRPREVEPADDVRTAAVTQPMPLDAAALANSYRDLISAERSAKPSTFGRQPADAAVGRRYFERMASEAAPAP